MTSTPTTSRQLERDLAEALGATPAQAATVVDLIEGAGLLAHGVVVMAAVAAARWGIELPAAVVAMAEGRAVPEDLSDYELRTAAEEGGSDLEDLWEDARQRGAAGAGAWCRISAAAKNLTEGHDTGESDDRVSASPFWIDPAAVIRG